MKEVRIIRASELTDDQQREFIIKDNVGFGEWDMDALANEWDAQELSEWGLDLPVFIDTNLTDADMDAFFAKDHPEPENGKLKIILEYVEDECVMVKEALLKIAQTPEQAVWELLNLKR